MSDKAPRPRKRRLALSLRGLLILILVPGGWLGRFTYEARVQRHAVAEILRARGEVFYQWSYRDGRWAESNFEPIWPKWVVDALGPDLLGHVTSVRLSRPDDWIPDDALMAQIAQLDRLEDLYLFNARPTGEGMAKLGRLTRLRELYVTSFRDFGKAVLADRNPFLELEEISFFDYGNDAVTDADLVDLAKLSHLKRLDLEGPVTDAGLAHLSGLTCLEVLGLSGTRVTDLTPLRNCTRLDYLRVADCPIDDDGVAPIAGLRTLQELFLQGTRVTDAAIPHLTKLPSLERLDLRHTRITDAGLARLADHAGILELDVSDTAVTFAGLAGLAGRPLLRTCKCLLVSPNITSEQAQKLAAMAPGLEVLGASPAP